MTPAGGGKTSAFDGIFGQIMLLLHVHNKGHSYFDAATIMDAIESSKGLKATAFQEYKPDRSNQVKIDLKMNYYIDSVLLSVLKNKNLFVILYKHSNFGSRIWVTF